MRRKYNNLKSRLTFLHDTYNKLIFIYSHQPSTQFYSEGDERKYKLAAKLMLQCGATIRYERPLETTKPNTSHTLNEEDASVTSN
jgi:hypothetical protein